MSNRTEYKGGFTCCEEDYGWRFWNKTGEILAKTATTKNDVSWRRNNIKELQNNHWLCPSEVDGNYEGDGFTPICRVYGAKNYINDIVPYWSITFKCLTFIEKISHCVSDKIG